MVMAMCQYENSNNPQVNPSVPTAEESPVPAYEKDALDEKIVREFPGKIVRKDLTSLMRRGAGIPTFVLEYLLGMYCATDDPAAVDAGVARIRKILADNYVRPEESEKIKSRIRELGQYTVIDKVSAYLDPYSDIYVGNCTNLSIGAFVLPDEYARKYTKVLMGGIWCVMRIQYLRPEDDVDPLDDIFGEDPKPKRPKATGSKKRGPEDSPFKIVSLTPIQMPNLDLKEFISHRDAFTTDEWKRLLLRSAGYEPDALSERERMHFLERMVPLIERNYNMVELGPRGTGKSHIYTEVSPYSYLLSGGQTTTAKLFASNAGRGDRMGLVGHWDVVAFDEVAGMRFRDENAVQIMKGYMANGSFGRGTDSYNAEASMVFEGNINDSVANVLKTTHLFDPFPPEFNNDSAFFDRIHCYLPGWEVPKMRSDLLTGRYGLITDCLSEFCKEMRKQDFTHEFDNYFRLNADFNQRDEIAVRKTFSGLAKLLFPTGKMEKDDALAILEYAVEGRRRVKEQLKIMAGIEFADVKLGYVDVDDPAAVHVVAVPEQADDTLIPDATLMPGHVFGIGRSMAGEQAVYKLENKRVAGDLKFRVEGVASRAAKDSLDAAFQQFRSAGVRLGGGMQVEGRDYLLYVDDVQKKGETLEVSLAEFVGLCSAACGRPVMGQLAVPGVLHLSGTLDPVANLDDVMRVAKNAGATKVLLPFSSIADLQRFPAEVLGAVAPVLYETGNPVDAAAKALGI